MAYTRKVYLTATVYGLCDPRTNELRYVGCTAQPLITRLAGHCTPKAAWIDGNLPKYTWVQELIASGLKPEIFEIETVGFCERGKHELFWIQYFRSVGCELFNVRDLKKKWYRPWSPEVREHLKSQRAYGKWIEANYSDGIGNSERYEQFKAQYVVG